MLIRIVKMGFCKQNIPDFMAIFENTKSHIRGFEGCNFLELYRDNDDPSIFFTYSYWDNDEALEAYRTSQVFKDVWSVTKPLFSKRPEAWSVHKLASLA